MCLLFCPHKHPLKLTVSYYITVPDLSRLCDREKFNRHRLLSHTVTFKLAHDSNKRVSDEKQWKNNKTGLQAAGFEMSAFVNIMADIYTWCRSAMYHAHSHYAGRDSFSILRTCWNRSNDFPAGVTRDCAFFYTPSEKEMDARHFSFENSAVHRFVHERVCVCMYRMTYRKVIKTGIIIM